MRTPFTKPLTGHERRYLIRERSRIIREQLRRRPEINLEHEFEAAVAYNKAREGRKQQPAVAVA